MKRLYLAAGLKLVISILVFFSLLSVLTPFIGAGYQHWHWLFPLASIAVAVLLFRGMKTPFYILQQAEQVLDEMLEGQFTSRITQVPWMGEAGHVAWNLNETLDQLETFFREVKICFELVSEGRYYRLWNMIESGYECFAYVKNMAKNGDYYRVFANVTVDYDSQGKPIGYFSVRRKPSRQGIEAITAVYQEMMRIEQQAAPRNAPDALPRRYGRCIIYR